MCHYTEFNNVGHGWLAIDGKQKHSNSSEGQAINKFLGGTLLGHDIGTKRVWIGSPKHPKHHLYKGILKEIQLQNGIFNTNSRRVDLTTEAYIETASHLGIEVPDISEIKLKKKGGRGRSSDAESLFFDHYGVDDRQVTIKTKDGIFFADGVIGNTVYEFMGDYWHANPLKYDEEFLITVKKTVAKDQWQKDIDRMDAIRNEGYDIIVVWESDWNKFRAGYHEKMVHYTDEKWKTIVERKLQGEF